MPPASHFHLGCPAWAHAPWRGTLFTVDARREDFLPQYASVFNTVEGNSTFYALPPQENFVRWAAEAPDGFSFCWKFPRTITHDLRLLHAEVATREFLDRVAPLAGRLGPFFLQVHGSFDARRLRDLETYLRTLPREHRYAIEVRSLDFFDGGPHERAFDELLGELGMERVNFDTRGVFATRATDEATRDAQRKKPRVPIRFTALGSYPFIRFVGDPEIERNDPALREWAIVVARWIAEGRTPYFFVHHPDDTYAPQLARRFQSLLHAQCPAVPPPASWPGERRAQLDLF